MWQRMLKNVGGGGSYYDDTLPLIQTGLFVNSGRCAIDEGGYFIKGGICFLDLTITLTEASTSGKSYVGGCPAPTATSPVVASNNGSWWRIDGPYTNVYYLTARDTVSGAGDKIRIIGAYATSASNTV